MSIGVPTRNRGAVLQKSLENICAQDYPKLEILISDNCSTDETEQVCRAAAARDARIRYVRQPHNIGLHANHNFCMDEARGEFFCFFHDHDSRVPTFVSRFVEFMQQHPRAGLVGSDWELIDDAGNQLAVRSFHGPALTPGVEYTSRTIRTGRSSLGLPGAMIRMEALGTTRFALDAPIGFGDFPIWFRIAERWDVGHIHERLSAWRQNVGSLSLRPIVEIIRDYQKNIGDYCDDHLQRWPGHQALVSGWRESVRRYSFWALAYEVALHFKRVEPEGARYRAHTMFEIMDYRLTSEQFERALSDMKAYRAGMVEHAVFAAVQALIGLHLTSPFAWIVRHQGACRTLLGLK